MPKVLPVNPMDVTAAVAEPPKPTRPDAQAAEPPKDKMPPREVVGRPKKSDATGAQGRKVVFPEIMVSGVVIPRKNLRVTVRIAKELLKYETETEYQDRMMRLRGGTREQYVFRPPGMSTDSKDFARLAKAPEAHFVDPAGSRVICWRNAANRPLREGWVKELMQDVLERGWHLNCETIIISKTGMVESGQHRLVGLIWAAQVWGGVENERWRSFWDEEPYIESLVACGAEETPQVLMTLDNTLARTDSDNFITMDLIDWTRQVPSRGPGGEIVWTDGPLSSAQKKECGKYLEQANELLWKRTDAEGKLTGGRLRAKTKSVAFDFVNKHRTLTQCVRHVWEENSSEGRAISSLGLAPGECSAAMYLMASSASDGDAYRNVAGVADRSEGYLDWSRMDKAKMFFSMLAAGNPDGSGSKEAKDFCRPLVRAIGMVSSPESGCGGTPAEKQAILAKAWTAYVERGAFSEADLSLTYGEDREPSENGKPGMLKSRWLEGCPKFGGIDVGIIGKAPKVATGTAEAVERIQQSIGETRRRRAEETARSVEEARAVAPTPQQQAQEQIRRQVDQLKETFPGKIILVTAPSGAFRCFGTDAMLVARATGLKTDDTIEPCVLACQAADAKAAMTKVAALHENAVVVRRETVPDGQPSKFYATPIREEVGMPATAAG